MAMACLNIHILQLFLISSWCGSSTALFHLAMAHSALLNHTTSYVRCWSNFSIQHSTKGEKLRPRGKCWAWWKSHQGHDGRRPEGRNTSGEFCFGFVISPLLALLLCFFVIPEGQNTLGESVLSLCEKGPWRFSMIEDARMLWVSQLIHTATLSRLGIRAGTY